jgi:hypothetical protein
LKKDAKIKPNGKELFSYFYNGQTAKIFRQMKDLSEFQTENSTKLFRKVVQNYQLFQTREIRRACSTNLNFGMNLKPSSNPLPTLW